MKLKRSNGSYYCIYLICTWDSLKSKNIYNSREQHIATVTWFASNRIDGRKLQHINYEGWQTEIMPLRTLKIYK